MNKGIILKLFKCFCYLKNVLVLVRGCRRIWVFFYLEGGLVRLAFECRGFFRFFGFDMGNFERGN